MILEWLVMKNKARNFTHTDGPAHVLVYNRSPIAVSLLGLLAKIKCSICSYQLNIWYAAHWVAHILNWFLELGCGKGACLVPATGCLGIALPPSTAHFLREDHINNKKIFFQVFGSWLLYSIHSHTQPVPVHEQPLAMDISKLILTWRGR